MFNYNKLPIKLHHHSSFINKIMTNNNKPMLNFLINNKISLIKAHKH